MGGRLIGTLRNETELALVERQHRPTIERRLAALLGDPAALAAGEVGFSHESSVSWVGRIKTEAVWDRLVRLREQALTQALPNVATLISGAMQAINGIRLAGVMREQIRFAPAGWQEVQRLRAYEVERDARLLGPKRYRSNNASLRRATTLGLFKIWCEGPRRSDNR